MTPSDWEYYFKVLTASLLGVHPDTVTIQYLDEHGTLVSATTEVRNTPDPEGHISLSE